MKPPHLPGLPTMAALMLATIFVAWLGMWGPIDLAKLRDWQTLMAAIIAPSIALYAATLAYKGAMAKVELDRDEARRRRVGERLALFFRLYAAMGDLTNRVGMIISDIDTGGVSGEQLGKYRFTPTDLLLDLPPEIEECWQRLDLFREQTIKDLDFLRRVLPALRLRLKPYPEENKWEVKFPMALAQIWSNRVPDRFLRDYRDDCKPILRAGASIMLELQIDISVSRSMRSD